jgi:hypothetical protein
MPSSFWAELSGGVERSGMELMAWWAPAISAAAISAMSGATEVRNSSGVIGSKMRACPVPAGARPGAGRGAETVSGSAR